MWRPGRQITPWLRDHAARLTKLNCKERFAQVAMTSALNEVGILFRISNPWVGKNFAKAISEVRPGGRANPTPAPPRTAELPAWKAEQDATKAEEDAAFALL